MKLIVAPENGFDALVSVCFADAYHKNHANPEWATLANAAKESALRQGTQYVMGRRVKARYLDPVHANVRAATAEAALRSAAGALYADIEPQSVASESVGPLSTSYTQPRNGGRMRFPVIDDLLLGFTEGQYNISVEHA